MREVTKISLESLNLSLRECRSMEVLDQSASEGLQLLTKKWGIRSEGGVRQLGGGMQDVTEGDLGRPWFQAMTGRQYQAASLR